MHAYKSSVFNLEPLELSGGTEQIVRGGRDKFSLLPRAFRGIDSIVFVGWGSQAPAQAQNLRDSLRDADCFAKVKVAVRFPSKKFDRIVEAGFNEHDETLGAIDQFVPTADIVALLINDQAQVERHEEIIGLMKPGSTLLLSHGFLLGYLEGKGKKIRPDINIILVCPKGVGKTVRRLYELGRTKNGAGINCSIAVEQDVTQTATDIALGWAIGIGSPCTFFTTGGNEWRSDLTGERYVLLAKPWAIAEALYDHYTTRTHIGPRLSYLIAAKALTSTVADLISEKGMKGLYESLGNFSRSRFKHGFRMSYGISRQIVEQIYTSVSSGLEIESVIRENQRLAGRELPPIDSEPMWRLSHELRDEVPEMSPDIAFVAGMYCAAVIAQMEVLRAHGHPTSEIINESLIEAIDSLLPLMDADGVKAMVDVCSMTARIGTRVWGPVIKDAFKRALLANLPDIDFDSRFLGSPFHGDFEKLSALRPTVRLIERGQAVLTAPAPAAEPAVAN